MIRRHVTALRLLFMAADGLTAAGLFIVVSMLRLGTDGWLAGWTAAGGNGLVLAVAYGVAWVTATWLLGLVSAPGPLVSSARSSSTSCGRTSSWRWRRSPSCSCSSCRTSAGCSCVVLFLGQALVTIAVPDRRPIRASSWARQNGLQHPLRARRRGRTAGRGVRRPARSAIASSGCGSIGHLTGSAGPPRPTPSGGRSSGALDDDRDDPPRAGRRRGRHLPAGRGRPASSSRSPGCARRRAGSSGSRSARRRDDACPAAGSRSSTACRSCRSSYGPDRTLGLIVKRADRHRRSRWSGSSC